MEKKSLEIHSENILPIIKKWLYSDKDIFARELVSNAIDALKKVKLLQERGELESDDEPLRIDIAINKDAKTITFSDSGIGMDAEEVTKYIAQIAFSGAEDFLNKYKGNEEKEPFIGHFGLGFYSAYMVADKVEINTLSYKKDATPAFWSCDGSAEYTLDVGTRQKRGTDIVLHINDDSKDLFDEGKLNQILSHYCSFLPFPVFLDGKQMNTEEPLWIKPASECTKEQYLQFYRYLYPMEEDPLFWVHLNVDYPFTLKGILYFPKLKREYDFNKNSIKLYCNRVFVSDSCKDLIPNYLSVLRGVIDSPDIPLNVSRSYLQMDRTVRLLANHISKKVSDSLTTLYRTEKERFYTCWQDVSVIIKLGAVEDEKFYERVKEFLIWKNSAGTWTTVEEYLDLNRDKTKNRVLYTKDEKHVSHILDIYKSKGVDVLYADGPVDSYVINFLERRLSPTKFERIDSSIDDLLVDKEREKIVVDASGRTEAAKLADFVRSQLADEKLEVEAKSLAADGLPGFIVIDEHQRRLRDYMMSIDRNEDNLALNGLVTPKFVINTNNKLIHAIQQLSTAKPDLAKELVKQAYDLALLSQREMDPTQLNAFVSRTTHVLEQMANMLKIEA
jgi:molecular chaperone HtpG